MDKILIVGPAWVGDMVMAQSLFKLLKMRYPECTIDVLAPAWSLPILERMPEVNRGITMPVGHGRLAFSTRLKLAKTLRPLQYQQAILLPNSFKSALVPWLAKIPKRTGWHGEMRYGLLNDRRKLDPKRYPLMIERFMALALEPRATLPQPYPLPALQSSPRTQAMVLEKYGLEQTDTPILVLCPGAEFGPAKRWPENYYAELANAKLAAGWAVWILGSPKDKPVGELIMQQTEHRCVNLCGQTELVEAIDLLAMASQVVTNDSGLMHIAAAVNAPMVALYGPTSTGFTPPLQSSASVLQLKLPCQPCFQRECPLGHHNCMQQLMPQVVLQKMDSA
jgi:heptosyltransferase-2